MSADVFELLAEDPEPDMSVFYNCRLCKDTGVAYQGHPIHMPGPCTCVTEWITPPDAKQPENPHG